MRVTNAVVTLLLAVVAGRAQVLAPEEIRDPSCVFCRRNIGMS